MGLADTVAPDAVVGMRALVELGSVGPGPGKHRVVNHVTERDLCINEIAGFVAESGRRHGYSPTVSRGVHNPRGEDEDRKASYAIDNTHVLSSGLHTPFARVLEPTHVPLLQAGDMNEAVDIAYRAAQSGDAVLLSPACASYDMFRNYIHRAEMFVEAVRLLSRRVS